MSEATTDGTARKTRPAMLVQPVTRFVASLIVTVVNGQLEVRPQAPSPISQA